MIIWLASYPRSGNTLLRTILKQSFELDSYDYEARFRDESITENLTQDAKEIIGHSKFTRQWSEFYSYAKESSDMFFIKTHSPPIDEQPAIYIIRDGRSATNSYAAYHKAYPSESNLPPSIAQLILGDDYYGSWSNSFLAWNDGNRPLLLLHFEDLVNPDGALLREIADFIKFKNEPKPFINPIDQVHECNPDFFRQGKIKWERPESWSLIDDAAFVVAHAELMQANRYVTEADIVKARGIFGNDQSNYLEQAMLTLRKSQCDAKKMESIIKEQSKALKNYHQEFILLRPFLLVPRGVRKVARRCISIFRPRLGKLNQYSPRPLTVLSRPKSISQLINAPKVSIVTPSFNQGSYIERTIQSVLDQQYSNLEYFIQDGGSRDDTVSVLKRYEDKLSGWMSEKDGGQSQAINNGFAHTTGEIMAWLNSDDLLLQGALALVVDYFNKHPEVDVIYGNRLLIDEGDMEIGRWVLPGHDSEVLLWADFVPQETLFWRRSIWNKAGGKIDESFRFAMDWDLLVRFCEAGAKFAHIPHFLGAFRIHEAQKTSAVISEIGYQEMDRIRERIHGRVPSRKEIRKRVLPFLLKHIWVDITLRIKERFKK